MRANTANEHMVAVKHQMLRRDGCGQQFVAVAHVFSGIFGGDMFEDHF